MKTKKQVEIKGILEERVVEPNITLKEVFERLIQLETKMDMKTANDTIVAKRFKGFTFIIIGAVVINLILTYFIYINVK